MQFFGISWRSFINTRLEEDRMAEREAGFTGETYTLDCLGLISNEFHYRVVNEFVGRVFLTHNVRLVSGPEQREMSKRIVEAKACEVRPKGNNRYPGSTDLDSRNRGR